MKQIIQSFKNGELWLAEVPVPACKSGGAVVQTRASFVSAGAERMLVDFAKKNIVGKALQMPDQVKKVIRKMKSEGIFETISIHVEQLALAPNLELGVVRCDHGFSLVSIPTSLRWSLESKQSIA